MAKIKLYNANNIVSTAVGTPGVNNLGSSLQDLAQNAQAATKKKIMAENAKIKIADNMEAEKNKIQWENNFYNNIEEQKKQKINLDDPYGLADTVLDQGQQSVEEYAQNITNPRVRDMFLQKSQSTIASAQKSMRNWASDQTTTNSFLSIQDSLAGMYIQAEKVGNIGGYNGLLSQGEAMIANAAPVIGLENAAKLRKQMRNEITKNFIYSQVDSAPGTVKKYIFGGVFDGALDAEDKRNLIHSVDALMKRNETQQKTASALGTHVLVNEMRFAEAEGTLTLKQVDNAILQAKNNGARQKDIDKLYSWKRRFLEEGTTPSGTLYPKNDTPSAVNRITDDLGYITGFTQAGKVSAKGIKVDKETTLNRLQKSQDLLDENRENLSKKSAEKFQNIINHGWMVYTDKNKYASKYSKILGRHGYNMNEFNQGLTALQTNADKMYQVKTDRQRAKALSIQYYNKYYDTARKMKGFNQAKFIQDIITRTKRAMETQ